MTSGERQFELQTIGRELGKHRRRLYFSAIWRIIWGFSVLQFPDFLDAAKWSLFTSTPIFYWIVKICFCVMGIGLMLTSLGMFVPQEWQKDSQRSKLIFRLGELVMQSEKEELSSVLSVLHAARGALTEVQWRKMETHLTPLLLHLDESACATLSRDARAWLQERVRRSKDPTFRVAALLVLADTHDARTTRLARRLTHQADERVASAAHEVLQVQKAGRL